MATKKCCNAFQIIYRGLSSSVVDIYFILCHDSMRSINVEWIAWIDYFLLTNEICLVCLTQSFTMVTVGVCVDFNLPNHKLNYHFLCAGWENNY